jgi:hypothetical protein
MGLGKFRDELTRDRLDTSLKAPSDQSAMARESEIDQLLPFANHIPRTSSE